MSRPRLVAGGACARGHVLAEGDIYTDQKREGWSTCRICMRQRRREGPKFPRKLGAHFRCRHPHTPENTSANRSCRICHAARANSVWRAKNGYYERQEHLTEKKERIVADWLAGNLLRQIATEYGCTHQYIQQVVARAGGMTVRVLREDFDHLLASAIDSLSLKYAAVQNWERATAE